MKRTAADPREQSRRAALNALARARRAALRAGVDLTDWEGTFLDEVAERVSVHGRAFGDPEKGAPGHALSFRQGRKLKEIRVKAQAGPPRHDA